MLSQEHLLRFIQTSGESSSIDAKGPIEWDGGINSAALAKDIVAFANSRDGGVIVIGKSEGDDGKFQFDGLSVEQASSFETTKIAAWINARFQPPVSVVCYHQDYEERRFVILVVDEFSGERKRGLGNGKGVWGTEKGSGLIDHGPSGQIVT